jgi:hypothetical protein
MPIRVKNMIEAIKSTLSVAPAISKVAQQTSNAKAFATNPDKIQEVVALEDDTLYTTRNVRVDNSANIAVLEFRNPLNGDVKTQIPTEAQLEAYERQEIQDEIAANSSFV